MKRITLFLICVLFLMPMQVLANNSNSDAKLILQIEKLLEERPDLVLDVLRKHSEEVLDIAQDGSNKKRQRTLENQWRNDMKIPKDIRIANRPIWGSKNAPVTIVEFSDFTCPYCAQGANTVASIKKIYGDKVNLVFKHTPLSSSPISILASEYVIAAGFQSSDKAYKLYTELFSKREMLLEKGESAIKDIAELVGLNMKKLARDVKSEKTKKILDEDLEDANSLEVEGTPYFFVNDLVLRGALAKDLFKVAVDMALKAKK